MRDNSMKVKSICINLHNWAVVIRNSKIRLPSLDIEGIFVSILDISQYYLDGTEKDAHEYNWRRESSIRVPHSGSIMIYRCCFYLSLSFLHCSWFKPIVWPSSCSAVPWKMQPLFDKLTWWLLCKYPTIEKQPSKMKSNRQEASNGQQFPCPASLCLLVIF